MLVATTSLAIFGANNFDENLRSERDIFQSSSVHPVSSPEGKMQSTCLWFLLLGAVLVTAQFPTRKPNQKVPEVNQRCMDCICQASSNCDETIKCHNGAGGGYFCGPYVISWAYWHDGGRPGDKGRKHDFETCLNNRTCAEEAVRGYMRKYGQDCDSTGTVDCFDFARIHKLGFGQCSGDAIYNSDYWEKFEICYAGEQPHQPPIQPPADPAAEYDYGDANDNINARNGWVESK
ncbi:hypothetical protein JTE90_026728 [Oedothorax gibbosus]|uniref:lysozyme n=1 Tax=Oedothorax gibbosus TaxID=931172 RepID=A0AAV6U0E4_9ARAC|nr:hypothetical protein JTE90_026728 [Oedothorax gibbosus]